MIFFYRPLKILKSFTGSRFSEFFMRGGGSLPVRSLSNFQSELCLVLLMIFSNDSLSQVLLRHTEVWF